MFRFGSHNSQHLSLKEVQQIELNLLKYFDSFCKQHGLRYYLDCGTLLGCIRHQGFIPWDDDIDVAMPLPDYDRLIALLEDRQDKQNVDILFGLKNDIGLPFAKLVDTRTITITPHRDKDLWFPVWIDIFPTFALSDNDEEAHAQVAEMYDLTKEAQHYVKRPTPRFNFLRRLHGLLTWGKRRKKLRATILKAEVAMRRYPWGSTKRVRITSIGTRSKLESVSPDAFNHCSPHNFEGGQYPIPDCYDEHLRAIFGDYMTPPPPEQRISHPNIAYRV